MRPLAQVRVEQTGSMMIGRLDGEVDLSNVGEVRALLFASVNPEVDGLVLDLLGTRYLDSTGVRMLFELADRLESRRQRLRLVVGPESVIGRVIELTRLDARVPVCPTVDDAMRSAAPGSERGGPEA